MDDLVPVANARRGVGLARPIGGLGRRPGGRGQDPEGALPHPRDMTNTEENKAPLIATLDRRAFVWLLLGGALLVASQVRFGVGTLAWIAPVPLLRYLRVTEGWRSRLAVIGVGLVAWSLAFLKIITAPLPPAFAPLFGVPIGLVLTAPYLFAETIRRRVGEGAAVVGFGGLLVCAEWVLHAVLPFGTWGSAANTQIEQLALMQLASVTGLHGVSFLVYTFAAALESLLAGPSRRRVRVFAGVVGLIATVTVAGQIRLVSSTAAGGERNRVAAVGTDSHVGQGPMPSADEVETVHQGLYARTRAAARAGASIVVWTEAATMTEQADESAFLEEIAAIARKENVTVVAGYVVPISLTPLRYLNRYAFVTPRGIDHVYDKHQPVPGEPAVAGTDPMPLYESAELGRVSGAICYDYDFPRLGLRHAALDVDLVVLPSSDWRGIDPLHTQMASVRAIEGGHSLVRSTRFGLSAGYDPYGRVRGWLSAFDAGDRVLVMSLPRRGVTTIYGICGDWFPLACFFLAVALVFRAVRGPWYDRGPWQTPSFRSPAEPCSMPASDSAWTRTRS